MRAVFQRLVPLCFAGLSACSTSATPRPPRTSALAPVARDAKPSAAEFSEAPRRSDVDASAVARGALQAVTFRIAELPGASLPEMIGSTKPPAQLASATSVRALTGGQGGSLRLGGRAWWTQDIQETETWGCSQLAPGFDPGGGEDGATATPLPMRVEIVGRAAGSKDLEYRFVDGWFDAERCRVSAVRRSTAPLRPIVPDLLYGFRACGATCAESESLVLVTPGSVRAVSSRGGGDEPLSGGGFTRAVLPLHRGTSESFLVQIAQRQLTAWQKGQFGAPPRQRPPQQSSRRAAPPPPPPVEIDTVVEVELVQGVGDAAPTAVAYIGKTERSPDPNQLAAARSGSFGF